VNAVLGPRIADASIMPRSSCNLHAPMTMAEKIADCVRGRLPPTSSDAV